MIVPSIRSPRKKRIVDILKQYVGQNVSIGNICGKTGYSPSIVKRSLRELRMDCLVSYRCFFANDNHYVYHIFEVNESCCSTDDQSWLF